MIRSFQRGAGGNGGTTITLQNVKSNTPFSKETKSAMPTARYKLTSSAVNGLIYCIGGRNDVVTASDKNEAYDPKTDTWATKTNLPIARYALSSAVVDGIIYCIGGILRTGAASNKNEAYDPLTDSWTTRTAGTARRDFGAVAVNGIIYCIGGKYGNFLYHPDVNVWTVNNLNILSEPRADATSCVVDEIIYLIGGASGSTLALNEAIIPEKYIKKYKVYGKYSAKFDKNVYVGDKLYGANTLIEGEDDVISFKVTDVSGSITVNDALITKL